MKIKTKTGPAATLSLAGASIVISTRAPATARLAAGELARSLFQLTGRISPVASRLPD